MTVYIEYCIYLVLILIAFAISIFKIKGSPREDLILSCLLLLTFISELIAVLLIKKYRNNLIVFHFFNPIQFFLIALYFNYVIKEFKTRSIGIYIGLLGIFLSMLNSLFVQKVDQLNTFYLLFEGIAIIAMTLHFFFKTVSEDSQILFRNKHVWIGMTFLLFWSATYSYWALSGAIGKYAPEYVYTISRALRYINIVSYGSLSVIFILNKKQMLHNGN